ncbi:hypothetical protein V5799_014011 [Amblyomma americanum]|uniref:Uncharacterized protein n=1 Tax=Amblyomma americanum TaxID=6943 RepID=A0AAQ4E490_AMBAM
MEESSRPRSRRRSSRSYSLLPSQNDLIKDVPSGIPGEERLRILLRLCFKRALSMVRDEVEAPEELYRKLLLRGLAAFDEQEGRDVLTVLLNVTAGSTPIDDEVPTDVAARHHTQLKALLTERKRWNELLEMDAGLAPPAIVGDDTDELPIARRRRYDSLVKNSERCKRAAAAITYAVRHCAERGETERKDTTDSLFEV